MTSIFGWKADDSGCGYFRLQLPLDSVQNAATDWRVEYNTRMPDWVRDKCDVIIAQRTCLPGPSELWQSLCASGKHTTVYELDDDLFNVDPGNSVAQNLFARTEIRDAIKANAASADVVTVSTEPLADLMREVNPNVVVLPNCIPQWLTEHTRPRTPKLTIGWGGSASHVDDIEECASEVRRFVARNPQTELHLMGGRFKSFGPARIDDWFDGVEDFLRHIDYDIALAPLRPSIFNRSKSNLKALEAAALGIPSICSDFTPYTDFVTPDMGILVSQPHEWAKALRLLVNDEPLRLSMGSAAREVARKNTIEGNYTRWLDAWGLN